MPEISPQHVDKLASIASVLAAVLSAIDVEKVVVPQHIQEAVNRYVAEGRCLRCEQIKGGRYTRGQCANCYNGTREDINNGFSEPKLIMIGRLTPAPQRGGRKPDPSRPPLEELLPLASEPSLAVTAELPGEVDAIAREARARADEIHSKTRRKKK